MPRFISESVLAQLQTKLHHLPDYLARLITLLLETGRRISEICKLPYECLETDSDSDYYLRVHDQKLSKHYLLPLSQSAVSAIKHQQSFVSSRQMKHRYRPTYFSQAKKDGSIFASAQGT